MFQRETLFRGLISASWLFGDEMTVTGIVLGGVMASRMVAAVYQPA